MMLFGNKGWKTSGGNSFEEISKGLIGRQNQAVNSLEPGQKSSRMRERGVHRKRAGSVGTPRF